MSKKLVAAWVVVTVLLCGGTGYVTYYLTHRADTKDQAASQEKFRQFIFHKYHLDDNSFN